MSREGDLSREGVSGEGDMLREVEFRRRFIGGGGCREMETFRGRQVSGGRDLSREAGVRRRNLSREVGVERRVLSGEAGVGHSDAVIRPVEMVLESLPQCWL